MDLPFAYVQRMSMREREREGKRKVYSEIDERRVWKPKQELSNVKRFPITCNARRLSVKYIFQSHPPYIKCQELLNYTRSSTQSEHFFSSEMLLRFVFFVHKFEFYVESGASLSAVRLVWWNKL